MEKSKPKKKKKVLHTDKTSKKGNLKKLKFSDDKKSQISAFGSEIVNPELELYTQEYIDENSI